MRRATSAVVTTALTQDADGPDGPPPSDWDVYAAQEYDFLVAEEAAATAGDEWEDA